jgi:hypothetical protein
MTILLVLSTLTLILLFLIGYRQNINEPYYKRINIKGESPWKCGSVEYGNTFDYKKQKSDRTYGVPNGCQKIF